jgi:hypothetical protein
MYSTLKVAALGAREQSPAPYARFVPTAPTQRLCLHSTRLLRCCDDGPMGARDDGAE